MTTLDNQVDALLSGAPYQMPPPQRVPALLEAIKAAIASACARNASYRNYVQHWPVDYRTAPRLADLPFLPVGVFKTEPPLALVEPGEVTRTLTSSATTGQVPSRVVLDAVTARRMTRVSPPSSGTSSGPNAAPTWSLTRPRPWRGGRSWERAGRLSRGCAPSLPRWCAV